MTSLGYAGEAAKKTWNQFRGPGGSGVMEESEPPVMIQSGDLAWKTALPPGLSSPVIAGDRIFLTAFDEGRLLTIALDRRNGQELWRRLAPEKPLQKVHKANTPASPSALVDKEKVYVYFGSYGLLAYQHDGTEVWKKPLQTSKSLYGASTSPIAYKDLLILVTDDDANLENSRVSRSRVLAFSRANGKLVWETARPFLRSGWSIAGVVAKSRIRLSLISRAFHLRELRRVSVPCAAVGLRFFFPGLAPASGSGRGRCRRARQALCIYLLG